MANTPVSDVEIVVGAEEVIPISYETLINESFNAGIQKLKSDKNVTRHMETHLEVINLIAPLLIATMATVMNKIGSNNNKICTCEDKFERLKDKIQTATFKQIYTFDKLEAHDREDNLILHNVEEQSNGFETDETIEQKIIEEVKKIGVDLKSQEISVAHRFGKRIRNDNGTFKPRPVICRFSKKAKKTEIARKKKGLKGKSNVVIYEDLTSIRRGLLNVAKDQSCVKACYSKAGRIMVRLHSDESTELTINTHEDLHKVGITNFNDWEKLNLQDYIF